MLLIFFKNASVALEALNLLRGNFSADYIFGS